MLVYYQLLIHQLINPYISAIYWINDYKNKSLDSYFTTFLGLTGTFVFAISGIRRASGKQIDWFGAYLIGLVTATGGGTVPETYYWASILSG